MIFNIFRSKPTLNELIPIGFVDIHSHVLPEIDDGAKNINESLNLIGEMKKLRFSKIICTPHTFIGVHDNTIDSIEKSYLKLKDNLNVEIKLSYASEYMLDESFLTNIRNNEILCLKENYILVEMSYINSPINLYEIIFEIITHGYIPILAHPERYFFMHNNFKEYHKLKKAGCLFQANLLSATDYYGKEVTKLLDKMLNKGLIDFVGSDIHNLNHIFKFYEKIKLNEIKALTKCIENNILKFKD